MNSNYARIIVGKCCKLALLALLFMAGNTVAAQCNLVHKAGGTLEAVAITSDFPVFISTGNETEDLKTLEASIKTWKTLHPDLDKLSIIPPALIGLEPMYYIEIAMEDFVKFSAEKQIAIQALPMFYHVNPKIEQK